MSWGSCKSRSESSPPCHFLVGAGQWCSCDGVTNIVLGFSFLLLRDREGMGKRIRGREAWAWWKGESIVSVATRSKWKEKTRLNTQSEGSKVLFSCLCAMRMHTMRMKTKSTWLVFYTWPFEGRLNPRIALRTFCPLILLRLVAHGLDKKFTKHGLCYLRNMHHFLLEIPSLEF